VRVTVGGFDFDNAVADFVDANVARGLGDKIAFTDSQHSLTYAQLQASSCRFAAASRRCSCSR